MSISTLTLPLPADLDLTPRARRPIALAEATIAAAQELTIPHYRRPVTQPRYSVIVVAYNNLAFTRMCLASVLADTADEFEVIVIDNGSTDGTRAFLHDAAERNTHIRPIINSANTGFAPANNQGLAAARGQVLVLLNNDTIVTPAWNTRLASHLADPGVGVVCPATNRIGNEAEVEADYSTYGQMLEFAAGCGGASFDITTACMFCLTMRRDVFNHVGPLDEQFVTGMFEDDDYSMRVRHAKYRVICAADTFVHHFGQASFGALARCGAYSALFESNRQRFEQKWNVAWQAHGRRSSGRYDNVVAAVHRLAGCLPPAAKVAVISKGDQALLEIGCIARHYPADERGAYRAFYPADSDEAVALLGDADFLLVPEPARWWLDHYTGLRGHLSDRRLVADVTGAGAVYDLRGGR